jgi:hypothetical protein
LSHIIDPPLSTCDKIHLLQHGVLVTPHKKDAFFKIEEDLYGKLKKDANEIISKSI